MVLLKSLKNSRKIEIGMLFLLPTSYFRPQYLLMAFFFLFLHQGMPFQHVVIRFAYFG
jgi:hypothetical protein